jgi:predicted nucleic acid-binding protein
MNYADTNWLEAVYIGADPRDLEAVSRRQTVERFGRKHGGKLVISQIVLLEARNVFCRTTGEAEPREWFQLQADFGARVYVDPMNWDILRRECNELFAKWAWKVALGTFDVAIVASAKLAGASQFLSFDLNAKVLAAVEGLAVFPPLDKKGATLLSDLKRASERKHSRQGR